MKKIKAKLGLSRAGMGQESFMQMQIEDAVSGVRFVELAISMEDFAYLVTGLHGISADCTLRGIEYVGMQKELKTIDIEKTDDLGHSATDKPDKVAALLAPYEVDGWVGYASDLFNYHRSVRGEKDIQTVSFHRYVEVDDNAED